MLKWVGDDSTSEWLHTIRIHTLRCQPTTFGHKQKQENEKENYWNKVRRWILMVDKLKEFYTSIGYTPYQELRIFLNDGRKHSVYPTTFEETLKYLEQYKEHNVYVGVNPRKTKGQSEEDVAYRRFMVFDLENVGKKPPLTDEDYKKRLERAITYIRRVVKEKCKGELTFIVSSGRGIHLYFMLVPLEPKYQDDYLEFYESIIERVNASMRKIQIKADPPVKDLPRIFGAPGTMNVKYKNEPSAIREIRFFENKKVELLNVLIPIREKRVKVLKTLEITRKKNPLKIVRKMPEYQMFKNKIRMPENSYINNRIRLNIRCKLRETGATREECGVIAKEISTFGYPNKTMFLPPAKYLDFMFMEARAQNWCFENYKWCVQADFPFPYFKENKNNKSTHYYEMKENREFEERELTTWDEVKQYAVDFNKETMEKLDANRLYFTNALVKHLENNCRPILWKFIKDNSLIEYLKYRVEKYLPSEVDDIDKLDDDEYMEGKNDTI